MKIVQLVFHLGPGGAEMFVADLSNALSEMGHEVVVMMIRDASLNDYNTNLHLLDSKIRVRSLALEPGFHLSHFHIVRTALDEENPDVVHGHLGVMPYIYLYSIFHRGIRFVHTIHSVPAFDIKNPFSRFLARFFYKKTITPVTISQTCSTLFEQCYGFTPQLIVNGRNLPSESPVFHDVRREMSGMTHPIFVHVARYAPEKNQQLLFDSFEQLSHEGVHFTLLVIGQGFVERDMNQRYQCIQFLGHKSNVCDYLRLADAFCLCSLVEGSPISLIEAFGCGATPVCTPAGGVPDMIQDAETGYLSRGFEVADYLSALRRFMKAPISRQRLIQHFKSLYTIQRCADRYLDVYSSHKIES